MKLNEIIKNLTVIFLLTSVLFFSSCSKRKVVLEHQKQRIDSYVNSDNEFISELFFDDGMLQYGLQPSLTSKELDILDGLADRIAPAVRREFDQKFTTWLICWAPLDSLPEQYADVRQSLKCNGQEFQELLEFCRQQDDDIFLLLYQLAARANCPYDQLLLHPAYELLNSFPEFSKYWREVDLSLYKEKPDLKNRTCNESTIWYTRKMLEEKYGYTYTKGLSVFFSTRKLLQLNI